MAFHCSGQTISVVPAGSISAGELPLLVLVLASTSSRIGPLRLLETTRIKSDSLTVMSSSVRTKLSNSCSPLLQQHRAFQNSVSSYCLTWRLKIVTIRKRKYFSWLLATLLKYLMSFPLTCPANFCAPARSKPSTSCLSRVPKEWLHLSDILSRAHSRGGYLWYEWTILQQFSLSDEPLMYKRELRWVGDGNPCRWERKAEWRPMLATSCHTDIKSWSLVLKPS